MSKIEDTTKVTEIDDENIKKIYTGENDEEVLNCEGGPCNFVYNDDIKDEK